jgi:flagellar hook assembly protein FlgD
VVSDHLIVSIYDASGRLLDTIIDENLEAGYYSLKWHGKDKKGQSMPTGVYFIQVRSGEKISNQKMVLIK